MKLEDLIDLEAQIALDRDRDTEALRRRDRAIYLDLAERDDRSSALSGWLSRLRERGHNPGLGARVAMGFRWTRRILVGLGLITGWGTAEALLAYREGGPPVNVGTFLLVVVGLQVALLVLFAAGLPVTRAFPNAPFFGDVRAAIRAAASFFGRWGRRAEAHLDPEARDRIRLAKSRLAKTNSIYAPVERWTLVGLSQTTGIAFNVGVLAACLRLVVFSDLAFGWSTTAEAIDAEVMHRVVSTLSAPWSELVPAAVPSRELVENSRYFRLEGRYAHAPPGSKGDPRLVGGWWPFLIAATVTYGLLPRLLLAIAAGLLRARALSRVPLDTAEVERIVRRMTSPRVRTQGDGEGARPGLVLPQESGLALPTREDGRSCVVVRWRQADAPRPLIERALSGAFGWQVRDVLDAGGTNEEELDRVSDGAPDVVVVVAEGWEPPDKGIRRWLGTLRERLGAGRPIWVVLVGGRTESALEPATTGDFDVWRDRLELLEDAHLGVTNLEAA